MKTVKVVFSSILAALFIIVLSGCWDYRELENVAIVSGVAIDKVSDGNRYLITAELVNPKSSGKESNIQSELARGDGKTILDAFRNILKVVGKRTYWSHVNIVIISQEVAKDGILPIVDFLVRSVEPRLTIRMLVSKERTAEELLSVPEHIQVIQSQKMMETLESEEKTVSKAPKADVRDFANALSGKGLSPVLPTVKSVPNGEKQTIELSGTALFKQDKLAGFLDDINTQYFLFIRNQIKDVILVLDQNGDASPSGLSIETIQSKTKLKSTLINNKPVMNIEVNMLAMLHESGSSKNFTDEKGREKLQSEIETTLKSHISNVIRKVQSEYDIDIFGFGNVIKREMPAFWKANSSNWDAMFAALDFNVTVNTKFQGSGLLNKPIKVGD